MTRDLQLGTDEYQRAVLGGDPDSKERSRWRLAFLGWLLLVSCTRSLTSARPHATLSSSSNDEPRVSPHRERTPLLSILVKLKQQ